MTAQLLPNLVYVALLVAALLTPYASFAKPARAGGRSPLWLAAAAIMAVAIVLTATRHAHISPLSIALLLPLIGLGSSVLIGGIAAILLFAPALWWRDPLQIESFVSAGAFVVAALAAALLPRLATSRSAPENADGPKILAPMILCIVIGFAVGLVTTPFSSRETFFTVWHHWGALLAPVDAWQSGGTPYRDFPMQYGLGPTSLLAAVCGTDCWRGMYWTAVTANALYFATLAGCVILLSRRLSRGVRWLALLALFLACFAWTGFPSMFAGPVMTPAVAGLRFLSISALLLHILVAEGRAERGASSRDWIGHLLWFIDLFWSPETAFFGTLIWWPYLAMRDASGATGAREALIALLRGGLRGLGALAIGAGALALLAWLLSGRSLMLRDFFAYIQHPPGALPANPIGTAWIALAAALLAMVMLARQGRSSQGRMLYACLLGFVGAGTYYLSRSHDNNILNLFPLLTPVLVACLSAIERNEPDIAPTAHDMAGAAFATGFVRTVLAAMVAFVTLFNFWPWADGAAVRGPVEIGPEGLISRFAPKQSDVPQILPRDAVVALEYLRGRDAGKVLMLNRPMLMLRSAPGTDWTSVNNLANFAPLPEQMILHYIRRGAVVYHRPGWLLVYGPRYGHWVDLFRTAYDVREQKQFGAYTAYYLVPR